MHFRRYACNRQSGPQGQSPTICLQEWGRSLGLHPLRAPPVTALAHSDDQISFDELDPMVIKQQPSSRGVIMVLSNVLWTEKEEKLRFAYYVLDQMATLWLHHRKQSDGVQKTLYAKWTRLLGWSDKDKQQAFHIDKDKQQCHHRKTPSIFYIQPVVHVVEVEVTFQLKYRIEISDWLF